MKQPAPPVQHSEQNVPQSSVASKARLKEIILNAVILGLLVLSFVFSWFMPVVTYGSKDFDVSVSASPFDMTIGESIAFTGSPLIENYVKNKDADLAKPDVDDASMQQLLDDIAFKRTYEPSAFVQWLFFDNYFALVERSAGLGLTNSGLTKEDVYNKIKEFVRLSPVEITHLNYQGFHQFILGCINAQADPDTGAHVELTEAKVTALQDKFLIGKVDFAAVKAALSYTNIIDMSVVATPASRLPENNNAFEHQSKKSENYVLSYVALEETTSILSTYMGIFMMIFGIVQLLLCIPVLLRLLRVIKGQPRKLKKIKKKTGMRKRDKHAVLVIAIIQAVLVILAWVGAFTGLAARNAGTLAGVSVVTLLVFILVAVAEVLYMKHVKKYPNAPAAAAPEVSDDPVPPTAE